VGSESMRGVVGTRQGVEGNSCGARRYKASEIDNDNDVEGRCTPEVYSIRACAG
jgi:hypothetical protein